MLANTEMNLFFTCQHVSALNVNQYIKQQTWTLTLYTTVSCYCIKSILTSSINKRVVLICFPSCWQYPVCHSRSTLCHMHIMSISLLLSPVIHLANSISIYLPLSFSLQSLSFYWSFLPLHLWPVLCYIIFVLCLSSLSLSLSLALSISFFLSSRSVCVNLVNKALHGCILSSL